MAGWVVCALEAKTVLMNFLGLLTFKGWEGCVPFKCLAVHICHLLLACLEVDREEGSVLLPLGFGGTLLHPRVLTGSPPAGDPLSCLINELGF